MRAARRLSDKSKGRKKAGTNPPNLLSQPLEATRRLLDLFISFRKTERERYKPARKNKPGCSFDLFSSPFRNTKLISSALCRTRFQLAEEQVQTVVRADQLVERNSHKLSVLSYSVLRRLGRSDLSRDPNTHTRGSITSTHRVEQQP